MAAPIIQADYDRLAEVARQFGRNAEAASTLQGQAQRSAQALRAGGWEGRGSAAFFAEMDDEIAPALQRLTSALRQAQDVSGQIGHLMRQAEEEAAEPFRGRDASGNGSATTASGSSLSPAGEHNDPDTLNMTETSGNLAEWLWDRVGQLAEKADTVKDGVTVAAAALLARGLKEGSKYKDEVIIAAPAIPKFLEAFGINKGWLRNQAGVAETLTHIKAENLAGHISR
ncbi:MAG: WXG100 family type VII secretion target, partial [Nitrosomonas ureae]